MLLGMAAGCYALALAVLKRMRDSGCGIAKLVSENKIEKSEFERASEKDNSQIGAGLTR